LERCDLEGVARERSEVVRRMSSRSDVQYSFLSWPINCTCSGESPCTCGARDELQAPVREEVTAHFLALRDVVYRHLRRLGCSRHDAEDVTQEAFLWLYRARLDGRRIDEDSVRPLVLTVARRRAIDRLRRLRIERPLFCELSRNLAETLPDTGQDDDGELELRRQRAALMRAIQSLSQLQRDCLHFRAAGLRLRETSAIVGVPEKRVSEAIRRGIRRLKRVLDGLAR
jgi:RNA polymerase sigma factor (sigma-70 family)